MSLRFAILTAVTERSATGLELARRFDRSIGYFWSASHQQIYRELERMEVDGLVSGAQAPAVPARGRPRAYRVTAQGRRALAAWVAGTDEPTPMRESLMVRMRAAAALDDPAAVRAAVGHHLAAHEEYLRTYRAIERRDFTTTDAASTRSAASAEQLQHRVLRCGIELEQAWARWCRATLEQLDDDAGR